MKMWPIALMARGVYLFTLWCEGVCPGMGYRQGALLGGGYRQGAWLGSYRLGGVAWRQLKTGGVPAATDRRLGGGVKAGHKYCSLS